jgi:molecular chaperone GrpE (heat shock protein)
MPAENDINRPDEFTSTMQHLVAEAAKTTSTRVNGQDGGADPGAEMRAGFSLLHARMEALERLLTDRAEQAATAHRDAEELKTRLQKIDEHMMALRSTESVNHRLFNSLHQELKGYRDNFLRDTLQKPFIRDLVVLFDDLHSLSGQMQIASAQGQWCSNLENALHAVTEILQRMEVTEIESRELVDRSLHRVVSFEPADFQEDDGRIVMRLKRGFMWRNQVLRPEEVVAKRFG